MWLEEVVKAAADGQLRSGPLTFADRVFQNEINYAIRDTQQVGTSALFLLAQSQPASTLQLLKSRIAVRLGIRSPAAPHARVQMQDGIMSEAL